MNHIDRLRNLFCLQRDRIFLINGLTAESLTFGSFFATANAVGSQLRQKGLARGSKIGMIAGNQFELLIFYWACLLNNFVVSPIDPLKSKNEIDEILGILRPDALVYSGTPPSLDTPTYALSDFDFKVRECLADDQVAELLSATDIDEPYLITFTSGTTGVPKGVVHSAGNLFSTSVSFGEKFLFSAENTFLHNLPMSYMAGVLNQFFLPLTHGSKLVVAPRFSIEQVPKFWEIPIRFNVNTFWIIPTIASLLTKLDRGPEGIQYCKQNKIIGCSGTAPLYSDVKSRFETKYGFALHESYGLSETLFVATNSPHVQFVESSVGSVLSGANLTFGEDDEIFISTPWNYLGYLTIDQSPPHAFPSGDLGQMDDEDLLFITGRKKDLIIRGGVNISPRKIENLLAAWGCFEESQIVGIRDQIMGEKTICFYSSAEGVDVKTIGKNVSMELGKDYQIDEFVKLNSLPKNLNGKPDKNKLREMYGKPGVV